MSIHFVFLTLDLKNGSVPFKDYPQSCPLIFQVSDYNMLPDISKIAEELKTCLQESDDIPRDITALFDNSLFKLDTSLVPKSIK